MDKWKGSWVAKFAAWVGITISGMIFLGSVVGAYGIWAAGVYEYPSLRMLRQQMFEDVANQYAIQALAHMGGGYEGEWDDTYFRYGIIKAESIDDLDLNAENTYVERNFTEAVTEDELFIVQHTVGDSVEYGYSGNLFAGTYISSVTAESYATSETVYDVIYNADDGIFYYETSGDFFPVQKVQLSYPAGIGSGVYTFQYDAELRMYQNVSEGTGEEMSAEEAAAEEAGAEEAAAEETGAEEMREAEGNVETESAAVMDVKATGYLLDMESIEPVLAEEYMTFRMLEEAGWGCTDWNGLILDDIAYENNGEDILWVADTYMEGIDITEETDYQLTEGNILHINHTDKAEIYTVVVLLPESVGFGWSSDLFVQANMVATQAYELRYSIYLIGVAAFAVTILLFVFLMSAAGHKKGSDMVTAGWLDKIPFDVYLGAAGLAESFLIVCMAMVGRELDQIPLLAAFLVLIVLTCWIVLLTLLTFAVRVKLGNWWRNTVIYYVLAAIRQVIRLAAEHMPLFFKSAAIFAVLTFAELFLLTRTNSGRGFLMWMLLEAVQFAAIFWGMVQMEKLKEGGRQLADGNLTHQIDTEKMYWEFKQHGENLNSISKGMALAVDERMKSERFKTELITNVSHDIKTPLTSIINYVDLLEKEEVHSETVQEYLEVLDRQSGRLKKLIEDLMEASKASTGNLAVNLERLEAGVSMVQTVGEFEEKTQTCGLELLITKPEEPVYIMADSRHFWRVIDNLMNNICKYAQPGTRVYINLEKREGKAVMTFRNTSKYPLNITSEELMERFVRGDSSRNTEGSGLGLSIAQSLMDLMGGTFELHVDGDLFKVVLTFDIS